MKRKKTILFFADRLPPLVGGVEVHGGHFINHFLNHPQYPIIDIIKGEMEKIDVKHKPDILFFNSGRWIERLFTLRSTFPNAVFIYRTGGNEILKAPLIHQDIPVHKTRQKLWVDTINQTINLIITNSTFTEKRLRNIGITVNFSKCVGGANEYGFVKQHKNIDLQFFCAARFVAYKNHETLIKAFSHLKNKGYRYQLKLAGDGPLIGKAQLMAKDNLMISFLGPLSCQEIAKEMSHADVYVQLSTDHSSEEKGGTYIHTEGMGRSILEAISSGTYVLAGKCGALHEIVTHERGKLISLEDVVFEIERLILSPPVKRIPTNQYSWDTLFKKYEILYESFGCHRKM